MALEIPDPLDPADLVVNLDLLDPQDPLVTMANLDWTVSTAILAIQVLRELPVITALPVNVVVPTVTKVPKDRLVFRALTVPLVNQEHLVLLASLVFRAIPESLAPVYLVSTEFPALPASLDPLVSLLLHLLADWFLSHLAHLLQYLLLLCAAEAPLLANNRARTRVVRHLATIHHCSSSSSLVGSS